MRLFVRIRNKNTFFLYREIIFKMMKEKLKYRILFPNEDIEIYSRLNDLAENEIEEFVRRHRHILE